MKLVVPIPRPEKDQLIGEVRDLIRPLLNQLTEKTLEKSMEPFKRTVRTMETNMDALEVRMNNRIDRELKETVDLIDDKVADVKQTVID